MESREIKRQIYANQPAQKHCNACDTTRPVEDFRIKRDQNSSVDHTLPLALCEEGSENGIDNFIVSCVACNRERGNRPLLTYFYDVLKEGQPEKFPSQNLVAIITYKAMMNFRLYSEQFALEEEYMALYRAKQRIDEFDKLHAELAASTSKQGGAPNGQTDAKGHRAD